MYQYTNKNNVPVLTCPNCQNDWTRFGGIKIELVVHANHNFEELSRLNPDGTLQDTEDYAVYHGYHSATFCGKCNEMLINLEGIEEHDPS